jgi:3-methyladenine DNA glycosylase AlkD
LLKSDAKITANSYFCNIAKKNVRFFLPNAHFFFVSSTSPNKYAMQFFPVIPHIDQQVEKAIQLIKLRKNGETADMLNRMGIVYRKNYGVSLVHIRQIAGGMDKNNDVANRLWARQIRETMILATLVADPLQMTLEQLTGWSGEISNAELTEQASMNLFAYSPHLQELVGLFIVNENPNVRALALFSLGWAVKFNTFPVDELLLISTRIIDACGVNHVIVGRGFSHLLRQLVRCGPNGLSLAQAWMERFVASDNVFVQVVLAEIAQEIEFTQNR